MGNVRNRALRWLAGVMALAALVMVVGLATGVPYARAAEQALTDAATTGSAAAAAADTAQPATIDIRGSVTLVDPNGEDRLKIFGGKLGFELKSVDDGPLPAGAENGSLTVVNGHLDEAGSVDFGQIDFSEVSLDGATTDPATGLRSKTFTYEVSQKQEIGRIDTNGKWIPATYHPEYGQPDLNELVSFDRGVRSLTVTVGEFPDGSRKAELDTGQQGGIKFTDTYSPADGGIYVYAGKFFYVNANGREAYLGGVPGNYGYYYNPASNQLYGKQRFKVTALDGAPTASGASGDSWIISNDAKVNPNDLDLPAPGGYQTYLEIAVRVTPEDMKGAVYETDSAEELAGYAKKFSYLITELPSDIPGFTGAGVSKVVTITVRDKEGGLSFAPLFDYSVKDVPTGSLAEADSYDVAVESKSGGQQGVSGDDLGFTPYGGPPDLTIPFSFKNYYEEAGQVELSGTKVVEGQGGTDVTSGFGGRLSFTLTGENGAPMPDGADPATNSITVRNGEGEAAGRVDFGSIPYTQADIETWGAPQTFTYTIREENPGIDGMSVVEAARVVRVTVSSDDIDTTDPNDYRLAPDADGKLDVTVTDENGNPLDPSQPLFSFTNHYTGPMPTSDTLTFAKTLDGEAPAEGRFSFELEAKGGAPLPAGAVDGRATATNAADGSVTFGPIPYDAAGTYDYVVREVDDGQEGVSYDPREYSVTVTVGEGADGALSATHVVTDADGNVVTGTATFENTTTPPGETPPAETPPADTPPAPDTPGEGIPQTGDATPAARALLALAGVAAALVALGVRARKCE